MKTPAEWKTLFESSAFARQTNYSGPLGPEYNPSGTRLRLWAPTAQKVSVNLYRRGDGGACMGTLPLEQHGQGVWSVYLPGDQHGHYYTFTVEVDGTAYETGDPYARTAGINGLRSMILDAPRIDPPDWNHDHRVIVPASRRTVWEVSVRDFSQDPACGVRNAWRGKFMAFTQKGTTLSSAGTFPTCLDYLKRLGVGYVQLMPIFDFGSVDESRPLTRQYNWGYDPFNYNAPEGSYSTDPADPTARIREMKEMIKALHDAGIGVVMDVVYNHTANNDDSNFSLTAPGYYYRHRADGSYSDASGCGNETASERQQMRDFIVNSVKYWAKEYHIDGFRFDLMAIHDTETMNQVAKELKEINPSIFVYGEGWTAGDSPLPVERRALKENVAKMEGIAVFSDDIRDAIKGHYSDAADRGFATGKPGNEETVKIGIVAATAHPQVDYSKGNNSKFAYASSPSQIINYVSCHDDLTLTDKLAKSMPGASVDDRLRAAKLAQTIVFTSQGTPFMFAGEEVFRDKQGVHNSYKSPDSINAIDWTQKHTYAEQFNYYKELIKLRKEHPAFRMRTAEEIAKNIVFDKVNEPNLISYSIKNNANGDSWKEIKLVFNGSDEAKTVKVGKGDWTVVAEDGKINADGLGTTRGGNMTVAPRSALILARTK